MDRFDAMRVFARIVERRSFTQAADDLGLPRRLSDVGVTDDKLAVIAAAGAKHPVVRGNPRSITSPDDVAEILKLAS